MKKKNEQLYICKGVLLNKISKRCYSCSCKKPHYRKYVSKKGSTMCYLKERPGIIDCICVCIPIPLEYYMKIIIEKVNKNG